MPTKEEAKEFYKYLTEKFEVDSYLGITYDFSFSHQVDKVRWQTFLDDHKPIPDRDGRSVFEVPSPWHACIVLFHSMAKWENNNLGDDVRRLAAKTLDIPIESFPSVKCLFRGQRCSDWAVNSSLSRLVDTNETREGNKRAQAVNAGKRFSALLKHALKLSGFQFTDDSALIAAAQHYQIPTNFIDFSLDPAIAVYFANEHRSDNPCASHPLKGSVFGIAANKLLRNGSLRVALPPPLFHRVYIQCGVFAEFVGELASDCRAECMEVRFERDENFQVLRGGQPVSDILKPNPFVQALSEDCLLWSKNGDDWDAVSSGGNGSFIANEFSKLELNNFESFRAALHNNALAEWLVESRRTFEGVTVGCVDGRVHFIQSGVHNLVDHNPVFSNVLAAYYLGASAGLAIAREKSSAVEQEEMRNRALANAICQALSSRTERIDQNF